MRIGILAGCLGRQDGGPETYERGLIRAIAKIDRTNEYRVYSFRDAAPACLGPIPDNVVIHVLRPRSRWVSLSATMPMAILWDKLEVLHAPLYPPPVCPTRLVFTMHDISPVARPEFFTPAVYRRLNPLVRAALRRARVIICVSADAMETTVALAGVERDRIVVVPHGVDQRFRPIPRDQAQATVRDNFGLARPYLLYVGKIMARKNIVRLVEAYAQFLTATKAEIDLVLAGKRLYDTRDVDETIARLGLGSRVHELGHVSDSALPTLYAGAEIFVYATLWEGFGLPVLEAMASGTPVVASNVSSLPEVAGDAALLVNPLDVEAIAAALHRLHEDPLLRGQLVEKAIRRAGQFTWVRTASETIRAYQLAATL
jgi:glycosyltransferase involved in cell wall biosynthesis